MNIGLLAVDSRYPNLALMKISSYHKAQGNRVEWYSPLSRYDKVYLAKVFTFTPDYAYFLNADEAERGGTGYDIGKVLPPEIDRAVPDYSLYGIDKRTAYGFLTRGCPNRCKWCVVPQKEGNINPYMDIEEIAVEGRNRIILMDNNVLASDYGLGQIENLIGSGMLLRVSVLCSLYLLYRFIYLRRTEYLISSEQIIYRHGVFSRSCDYMELYRVVDFREHRSFLQQLTGLKTVSVYSGDRMTPKLDIYGVEYRTNLVGHIRERVETNKQRKGIYEITNR